LVIGGTGQFGARISRRLAKLQSIELLISSRDQGRAEVLAQEIQSSNPNATVSGIALDQRSADFESDIKKLVPFIVIHTTGPYQGQDYRVAEACIAVGSHYIDLADGRQFVDNFKTLNDAARRSGVLLVSGASTLPGISTAVIDVLKPKLNHIDGIEISIAPAHQTPRGPGTVAAVLSYCGQPFRILKDGNWQTIYGWQNMRVQKHPALGRRLSGACDVPDLSLLPEYVPGVKDVSFHAALEASWEQISLWIMAWMTRLHVSRGTKSKPVTGMVVGFLAGIPIGATAGWVRDTRVNQLTEEQSTRRGLRIGAVAGLVLGGLIGMLVRVEQWDDISDWIPEVRADDAGTAQVGIYREW